MKILFSFSLQKWQDVQFNSGFFSFNVASGLTSHLLTQTASAQRGLHNLQTKSLRLTVRQSQKEKVARTRGKGYVHFFSEEATFLPFYINRNPPQRLK